MFYSQEIPTAGKLRLAQNSTAVEIQRFQWDNEAQQLRVLNDLKVRYYEVLGAQEALAVTERIVTIAESIESRVKEIDSSGWTDRSALLQASTHVHLVRLSRDDAKLRYEAAWEQLATIVGCSPMQPVPLLDSLEGEIPSLELESSWQHLLYSSPQLRANESDLSHAWALHREARAQAIPNLTVQIVSEYDRATQATTVGTLVAAPIPFFNRNQGNIDKTVADIRSAEAEVRRVQLVLRDQLSDTFRRYKSTKAKAETLKLSILPNVEQSLEVERDKYKGGLSFLPVLSAQQDYFKNQIEYVDTLTELRKEIVMIEGMLLSGGLNPASIGSAIQSQPGGGGGAQRQRALLNESSERSSKQIMNSAQIAQ